MRFIFLNVNSTLPKIDEIRSNAKLTKNIVIGLRVINSFMTEAVIIYKPVYWFAPQINGLVSIW